MSEGDRQVTENPFMELSYAADRRPIASYAELRRLSIGRKLVTPGQTPEGFYADESPLVMIRKSEADRLLDYAREHGIALIGEPVSSKAYLVCLDCGDQLEDKS